MKTTERQEQILNSIIQEYINRAKPISSEFLQKKCNLNVCPATIRAEMQRLTDMDYLCQPHTSAGRVPTNKGYRFFVDKLLDLDFGDGLFFDDFNEIKRDSKDNFRFVEAATRTLASASSSLVLAYLFEKDFLWEEGWKEVFQNPEFKEASSLEDFIKTVKKLEKDIKKLIEDNDDLSGIKVFIGREKFFLSSKDFSLVASKGWFSDNERGLFAIFGPKRMAYDKNISLINSLIKSL